MTVKNPLFQQNAATGQDADEARLLVKNIMAGRQGVAGVSDLLVTQRGAGANMSVDVLAGGAFIAGTENALQGTYHVTNDATVNVVVSAADATNARKDLVILRVRDSFYSGGSNDAQLVYLVGTPAGSPVEPDPDALGYENYIVLAMVDVPATDTTIANAQITDRRTRAAALGGVITCTSATQPASPPEGLMIWETDTNRLKVYDGTAWRMVQSDGTYTAAGTANLTFTASNASNTPTVNFGVTFSAAPFLVLTASTITGNTTVKVSRSSISTTQFTMFGQLNQAATHTGAVAVHWIAVGTLA
jgi:hypothetical protein